MKHYLGFAIRIVEKDTGILFKRKKQEEIFSKIEVGADNFAEAQETLCDKMSLHKISVAFIFPFAKEDMK